MWAPGLVSGLRRRVWLIVVGQREVGHSGLRYGSAPGDLGDPVPLSEVTGTSLIVVAHPAIVVGLLLLLLVSWSTTMLLLGFGTVSLFPEPISGNLFLS